MRPSGEPLGKLPRNGSTTRYSFYLSDYLLIIGSSNHPITQSSVISNPPDEGFERIPIGGGPLKLGGGPRANSGRIPGGKPCRHIGPPGGPFQFGGGP